MAHPHLLNRYAYANNNPLRYTDPSGMDSCPANSIIGSAGAIHVFMDMYGFTDKEAIAFLTSFSSAPTSQLIEYTRLGHDINIYRWMKYYYSGLYNKLDYISINSEKSNPWYILWELQNKSNCGGWIVQELTISIGIDPPYRHWEAWEVKPGSKIPVRKDANYDDRFYLEDDEFIGITYTYTAEARFYEGLQLPDGFVAGSVPRAGNLRATTTNPNLSIDNATAPVIRTWTAYSKKK